MCRYVADLVGANDKRVAWDPFWCFVPLQQWFPVLGEEAFNLYTQIYAEPSVN